LGIAGVSVNVVLQVPASVFVVDHEQADEFAVHVLGTPVRQGHSFAGDQDHADEAALYIFRLVGMGVVEPHHGAGIAGPGPGTLWDLPDISVGATRRHAVLVGERSAVGVAGTFGLLFVKDAVRVHGKRMSGVVFEDDLNGVANLGAQHRADEAQV